MWKSCCDGAGLLPGDAAHGSQEEGAEGTFVQPRSEATRMSLLAEMAVGVTACLVSTGQATVIISNQIAN